MKKQSTDSKEELYFEWFLEELENNDFIKSWSKAQTYRLGDEIVNNYKEELKTKTKQKKQIILNSCEYTPDYEIHWTNIAKDIFCQPICGTEIENNLVRYKLTGTDKIDKDLFLCNTNNISIVEVKANFDQNNMTRLNTINRKWVYQKYNVFVNLVKVPNIFEQFFTPKRYLMTDSGKQQRLIKYKIKTLEDIIEYHKTVIELVSLIKDSTDKNKETKFSFFKP